MGYRKRIVAIILSLLMIVNVIPTSAYASELEDEQTMIDAGMNTAIAPESSESNLTEIINNKEGLGENSARDSRAQADVLLIKNKNPWDSSANEIVLSDLGISYKVVTIESATSMDLSNYKLIIVANDQNDDFYRTLSKIRTELELFVMNGGTLLYGICDAGWGSGYSDLSIPGDIQLGNVDYQKYNYIVDTNHPIVTGLLTNEPPLTNSQLYNNYASHRYFELSSLPSDTNIILNAGDNKPTLIEYPMGNGIVIASTLTWEHSYSTYSNYFGRKAFDDLLLYSYMVSKVVSEINKNPDLGYDSLVKGLTCTAGDPVNVANGNFLTGNTDMSYEGNISINFSRYYNSLDSYQGVLGKNWRGNYDISLQKLSERRLRLWHADGHSEEFIFGDDGLWYSTPGTNSKISVIDSNIIITLEDKTVYQFDNSLKLISLKAPYDNEIRFEYNDLGKLILAKQGEFWLSYEYENELLSEVSDKSGRTVKFKYTEGNLVSVESYDGKITKYEYDNVGRITKLHINEEYTIQNIYDEYGRVIEQKMPLEGNCKFIYDDENYTTTYIDKNGATTVFYKDEQGRIYQKEYLNGSEALEFDSKNNIVKRKDKLGNLTDYQYDEYGDCISETDALGHTITYEYDEQHNKMAMIDAENNRYVYTYDSDNYLLSQSDAYGEITYFEYDEKKQPIKITLPNQKELHYEYDEYGNVISSEDSDGNQTFYSYNDMNQVVKEIDANGGVIQYEYSNYGRIQKKKFEDGTFTITEYDDKGNQTEYTDELGNKQLYEYNSLGLLTMVTDEEDNSTVYEYDCMNNVSKITNPDASYREYTYDAYNNLVQVIDEEGYAIKYKYDANGNIIEEVDGNNNVTQYNYDALNRMVTIKDAKGNVTTKQYSPNNKVLSIIDANGNKQQYEYNKNGQLIKSINEANEEEVYEYDAMGYVSSATDANGNKVKYEYNGSGIITKVIYPDESNICIDYDGLGNMISYIEPNGKETRYSYDKKGNLLSEKFADGSSKQYSYDVVGNQISSIDENGNITKNDYDGLHRLTKVVDAIGNQTIYSYDSRNNLLKMIQHAQVQDSVIQSMKKGKGTSYDNSIKEIITNYEYDKKNQLVKETSPTAKATSYQYDANGNMTCKVDPDQIVSNYVYDVLNNLIEVQYGNDKKVTYQYNATNSVVGMSDWNGITTYEVDPLGRILSVVDPQHRKIGYEWNSNNQKSLIVYPDGSTVSYQYDNKDQLTQVNDSVLGVTTYEYDNNGNVIQISAPNGKKTINAYDSRSRLIQKTDYDSANKIVNDFTYSYDKVGNKLTINRDKKLGLIEKALDESNGKTTYQYNSLNQLISQTNSNGTNEKYFYDSLGNRVRKETWSKSKLFLTVSDYSYNSESQLQQVKGNTELVYGALAIQPVSMKYDGRGNLVEVSQNKTKLASFKYDETNTMIESKNLIGLKTEYEYDGNGSRISKTTSLPEGISKLSTTIQKQLRSALTELCDDSTMEIDNYVSNYYVNDITSDYNNVLFTYGNYSKNVRYTYGLEVIGAASFGSGLVDWTIEQDTPSNYSTNCNVYYFLDEQNTPTKLTNQKGKVVEKYSYDEYGLPNVGTYVSNYIGKNNIIGYAGYQYDKESGLYFVQARYYNPNTGSFVSKDAFQGILTDVQSLNRYAYCYGNPITYVDPSGYYTTIEGIAAHQALQAYFLAYYNTTTDWNPYVEYNVYGIIANISMWGRADMVLDKKYMMEVYEIKPYSDKEYGEGRVQLQGYVTALDKYSIKPVTKGTTFMSIVNGLRLPYPLDTTRIITYYSDPSDPGMIYYNISTSKKNRPVNLPAVVPDKKDNTSKVNAGDVCEGVAKGVGTAGVAYVIYRVIRFLPSCTPWTWWTVPANLATP
jgi:RHS repeat-associated protein